MKYIIDENKKKPAYLQLYMQVRDDFINGIYLPGSKLPSKRVISADTGVSTITVEHSYALLADEGYIEARERSGYFVIFNTDSGFASSVSKDVSYNFSQQHNDSTVSFPFSVLAKTMRSVISNLGEGVLDRSPNFGRTELRDAIRIYLAKNRGIFSICDRTTPR